MGLFQEFKKITNLAEKKLQESDLGKIALQKLEEVQKSELALKVKDNANEFKNEVINEYNRVKQHVESKELNNDSKYDSDLLKQTLNNQYHENEKQKDLYLEGVLKNTELELNKTDVMTVTPISFEDKHEYVNKKAKVNNLDDSSVANPTHLKEHVKNVKEYIAQKEVYDVVNQALNDFETSKAHYPEILNTKSIELMNDKDKLEKDIIHIETNEYVRIENMNKERLDISELSSEINQQQSQDNLETKVDEGGMFYQFKKLGQTLGSLNKKHLIDILLKLFGYKNKNLKETQMQMFLRATLEKLSGASLVMMALFLFRVLFRAYGFKFLILSTIGSHFLFKKARQSFSDENDTEAGKERKITNEYLKNKNSDIE